MIEYTIALNSRDQITIPKLLRSLMDMKCRQELLLTFKDDVIILSIPTLKSKVRRQGRPTTDDRRKAMFARQMMRRVRKELTEKERTE